MNSLSNKQSKFESSTFIQSSINRWSKSDDRKLSLREWAKLMKLSPTYLSLILKSHRLVSEKALTTIAAALDLDKISTKNLKAARQRDWLKIKNPALLIDPVIQKNREEKALYAEEVLDCEILLKSWAHMAFLDYTTCHNRTNDIESIAKLFNLSPISVKQILYDLKQSGFLKQNPDGSYTKTEKNLRISVPRTSKSIRAFHIAMMKKATETLEKEASPEEVSKRLVGSYTVAANENQLEKTFELINQTFSQAIDQLKIDPCTTLYQVQFQVIPLLKSSQNKKETL